MSEMSIEYSGNFSTTVFSSQGNKEVMTDAPKHNGGRGEKLSPTDLFAASLGSCILTILSMYAKKMEIPFDQAKARVVKTPSSTGSITSIDVIIEYPARLTAEQKAKLETAALHCPIHQCIHPDIKQTITIVERIG